jgi:hypothetical protein
MTDQPLEDREDAEADEGNTPDTEAETQGEQSERDE